MRGPVGNVTWQLASRGAYRVRREIARVRALLPRRLLSNPEATGSKGLHASKELRSPDVPIASRPTVVLRRRSGSVGMPRRGRQHGSMRLSYVVNSHKFLDTTPRKVLLPRHLQV